MRLHRLVSVAAWAACLATSYALPAKESSTSSKHQSSSHKGLSSSEISELGSLPLPTFDAPSHTSSGHHSKTSGKGSQTGAPSSTGTKHGSTTKGPCATPTYGITGPTMGTKVKVSTTSVACGKKLPSGYTPIPAPTGAGNNWINAPKKADKCKNPKDPNKECYDDLHLVDFARWWWARNEDSCKSNKPDAMGFADCFFVRATPYAPVQCDKLQANPFCQKPDWSDFQSMWMPETHFYLAWTIFNVNSFFHNYYDSVLSAGSKASEDIAKVVALIDPPKDLNTKAHTIFTILTSAMYLIPAGPDPISNELLLLAQQSVSIQNLFHPLKTIDTQFATFADVGHGLEKLTSTYQDHLAQALHTAEGNVTTFLEMTKGGIFTGFIDSLPAMDDAMTKALLTYIVSETLKSKGAYIGVAPDTNVQKLATNGTHLNWGVSCDKYDSSSMCGVHFYDEKAKTTYSMAGVPKDDDWGDALHTIINKLGVTTPEMLFATTPLCHGPPPGADKKFITDHLLRDYPYHSCFSSFKRCTWKMDIDYHKPLGPQVFTDCSLSQYEKKGYTTSCNQDWQNDGGTDVPGAYLGGMLRMGGQPKRSDVCILNYDHGQDHPPPPSIVWTARSLRGKEQPAE